MNAKTWDDRLARVRKSVIRARDCWLCQPTTSDRACTHVPGVRGDDVLSLCDDAEGLREAIGAHLMAEGMMCEELTEEEEDAGLNVCENLGCTYCGLSRALGQG